MEFWSPGGCRHSGDRARTGFGSASAASPFARGPSAALILGASFVVSNGTVQSAVSSWALGSSLRLHPVGVLLATMIGGTIAGLLGMIMGAPVVAAVSRSVAEVRRLRRA
ncbi:MAG: AI-2E family transporter [Mycobacterium sp.]